jgi:ferredoxin
VRYLILALMIALLPLRGWAGNAMAIQMAVQAHHQMDRQPGSTTEQNDSIATHKIANTAHSDWAGGVFDHEKHEKHEEAAQTVAGMPSDCLEHMSGTGDPAIDQANADCGDCSACQICHVAVLTGFGPAAMTASRPLLPPQPVATPFASAEAAQGQKPPIS